MKEVKVKKLEKNKEVRLTTYITKLFPKVSINAVRKALKQKDIKVNGKRVSEDVMLKQGDDLLIYISDELLYGLPSRIDIIYEDENILVAYKPAGILAENKDKKGEMSLEDILQIQTSNNELALCHRLDRNTKGLIILAKNKKALEEMFKGFKNSYVHKTYNAYVYGILDKKENTLNNFLVKDAKNSLVHIYDKFTKGSKKITTSYKVLKEYKDYSLLEVKIKTGKTHQIRAHFAYIGHPILGDEKYGRTEINNKFKNRFKTQALEAVSYSFSFPDESFLSYLNDIYIEK